MLLQQLAVCTAAGVTRVTCISKQRRGAFWSQYNPYNAIKPCVCCARAIRAICARCLLQIATIPTVLLPSLTETEFAAAAHAVSLCCMLTTEVTASAHLETQQSCAFRQSQRSTFRKAAWGFDGFREPENGRKALSRRLSRILTLSCTQCSS